MLRIIFGLLLLPLIGQAQPFSLPQLDSLRLAAHHGRTAGDRTHALTSLCAHFATTSLPDSVQRYCALAESLNAAAPPAEKTYLIVMLNSHLAGAYRNAGNHTEALTSLEASLVTLLDFMFITKTVKEKERNQRTIAAIYTEIASLHQQMGALTKADSVYGHVVEFYQTLNDTINLIESLNNRSLIQGQLIDQYFKFGNDIQQLAQYENVVIQTQEQMVSLITKYLQIHPGQKNLIQHLLLHYARSAWAHVGYNNSPNPEALAAGLKQTIWLAHQAGLDNAELLRAELAYTELLNTLHRHEEVIGLTTEMLAETKHLRDKWMEINIYTVRHTAFWMLGLYRDAVEDKKIVVEMLEKEGRYRYATLKCDEMLQLILSLPMEKRKELYFSRLFFEKKADELRKKAEAAGNQG